MASWMRDQLGEGSRIFIGKQKIRLLVTMTDMASIRFENQR